MPGSWTGNIGFDKTIGYGTTVPTIAITERLTQSDMPDSNGFFQITGTITVKVGLHHAGIWFRFYNREFRFSFVR